MAKEQKVKTLTNISPSVLTLWDGQVINPGDELEMTEDLSANLGVQSWIADGLLGEPGPAVVAEDTAGLKAALATSQAEVAQLQAEKSDLQTKLDAATAELAKATTPQK